MDKYNVKFMSRALRDLDGIYEYIARTLLEPNTAINLVEQIEKGICSLKKCRIAVLSADVAYMRTVDTDNCMSETIPRSTVWTRQRSW